MSSIAGHTFIDHGERKCSICGKTWLSVLADREFWRPGETGIACRGALNDREVGELNDEVERIWAAVTGRRPVEEDAETEPALGYMGFCGMVGF